MADTAKADHHYKFNVKMTCGGCSGAVERVLKKTEGTIISRLFKKKKKKTKPIVRKKDTFQPASHSHPSLSHQHLPPPNLDHTSLLSLPLSPSNYPPHFPSTQPNNQTTTNSSPDPGLSSYTVSLDSQTADVYTAEVPYETVLETIKKTGKTVVSAQKDGVDVGV